MTKLIDVEGIGANYVKKLNEAGIKSIESLLAKAAAPKNRKDIAEKTGISEKLILEWVNHADLYRVKGIGEEYSDLLEEAGVDTVPELAQRNAANLYEKLVAVNKEKKLVRRVPVLSQVTSWVEQAKQLPKIITY